MATGAVAQSVSITSPASGATVASPMRVTATASSTSAVTLMQIYLDGSKKFEVAGAKLDTSVSAATGIHRLTVQAYDSAGHIFKSTMSVAVGSTTSGGGSVQPPIGTGVGTLISNIDQMTGWASCDRCAGANGAGPVTRYSMTQNIASPSLDGRSVEFKLMPVSSYNNALWWKQLGAQSGASHFVYDLYFYLKNPSASQALEFDVNQSLGGKRYIFGSECGMRSGGTWRIWDYYLHWQSTGIACAAKTAFVWHHLTWELERVNGKTHFIAVTLDGVRHYVNKYYNPQPVSVNELNVAFQMDGIATPTTYSVWVDKVSLKYW
ncbi:MAG TPA: Ig-like domain-containing protein [Terriglobales bacterium]|nr:Ig-like domain-containing protein [Terriglobales bacterium]